MKLSNKALSGASVLCLLAALLFGYVVIFGGETVRAQGVLVWFSVADVTVSGTPAAVGSGSARICQLTALPTNGALVRWGDSLITTSRGSFIAPGGGQFLPPGGVGSAYVVDLAATYVVGTAGDKVAVTCAK